MNIDARIMRTAMRHAVALAALCLLWSCACHRTRTAAAAGSVAYSEARHYFFNNDAQLPSSPVVTTQTEFDRLYGAAAVMGSDGQPTPVDFARQFVIGIVLPLTNDYTEVVPGRLTREGDTLTLHYTLRVGERNMSWTMRPMALVVVDRSQLAARCVLQQDR